MSNVTMADWRRWAIFGVLAEQAQHPLRVSDLVRVLSEEDWGGVLPPSGHYDAVRRAATAVPCIGHSHSSSSRAERWTLTQIGHEFAYEFVLDNSQHHAGADGGRAVGLVTLPRGLARSRLGLNDSRCLTTVAPLILPLPTVECEVSTKAPPRSANCRGHGNGSEVPMHEQSIPTRHDARPARRRAEA